MSYYQYSMKKCWPSLIIKEIEWKSKPLIRVAMTVLNLFIYKRKIMRWCGYGEIRTLMHCWLGCKMKQLLWKTVWWFSKWLNIELTCDPAISLPLRDQENKNIHPHKTLTQMFLVALFITAKGGTGHPLISGWIKWDLPYNMDGPWKHYAKWKKLVAKDILRFHSKRISFRETKVP